MLAVSLSHLCSQSVLVHYYSNVRKHRAPLEQNETNRSKVEHYLALKRITKELECSHVGVDNIVRYVTSKLRAGLELTSHQEENDVCGIARRNFKILFLHSKQLKTRNHFFSVRFQRHNICGILTSMISTLFVTCNPNHFYIVCMFVVFISQVRKKK